jgi:hypothetical protein
VRVRFWVTTARWIDWWDVPERVAVASAMAGEESVRRSWGRRERFLEGSGGGAGFRRGDDEL